MTRSPSRNKRRKAQRFRKELLKLVTAHDCRVLGRVWVKEPGKSMAPVASYCYAVRDIARHFSQYLQAGNAEGILIADQRTQAANIGVAQSVFTQKWKTGGDPYPFLREVPVLADSDNHAGLQMADLIVSTLVFPMAADAFCATRPGAPHSSPHYHEVRTEFGPALKSLQFRYRDETGRWRGGLVVSDPGGQGPARCYSGRRCRLRASMRPGHRGPFKPHWLSP
jgi:Protein of unknown function (DUF3800)